VRKAILREPEAVRGGSHAKPANIPQNEEHIENLGGGEHAKCRAANVTTASKKARRAERFRCKIVVWQ
jgi:hypothetical protein